MVLSLGRLPACIIPICCLWDSDEDNLSPHIHPIKAAVKKPSAKGAKAKPVEKISVEQLLQELENTSFSISEQPYGSLFDLFNREFLQQSVYKQLINPDLLALACDSTPFVTSARKRKHRVCNCAAKGINDCSCDCYFSQPDCDIGWDSSRSCFYHGYDLYMLTASVSKSDLPVFPLLNLASRHDSHGFLHTFFRMKSFFSEFKISKLLLDSAHDAMPINKYCKRKGITPFIDLNEKRGIKVKYKNDFIIGKDGVPVCKEGRLMNHDGSEPAKNRIKYRCPLASRKYSCSCEHPCSDSKYGRTSAERSNKREKYDFLLENGRHHSSKMWYCRLYNIMMLQHLDAWDLPYESTLKKLILEVA